MSTISQCDDINTKLHLSRWPEIQERLSALLNALSGMGAKGQKSEHWVLQTAKDKALGIEGVDKSLYRFWQVCVISSTQGGGRKSQRGHAATRKNCFLFQTLPVLFFLSILTSHFHEIKMMEADKKWIQLRLILSLKEESRKLSAALFLPLKCCLITLLPLKYNGLAVGVLGFDTQWGTAPNPTPSPDLVWLIFTSHWPHLHHSKWKRGRTRELLWRT